MISPYGWRHEDTHVSRFDNFFFFCTYNTGAGNGNGNTFSFVGLAIMGEEA